MYCILINVILKQMYKHWHKELFIINKSNRLSYYLIGQIYICKLLESFIICLNRWLVFDYWFESKFCHSKSVIIFLWPLQCKYRSFLYSRYIILISGSYLLITILYFISGYSLFSSSIFQSQFILSNIKKITIRNPIVSEWSYIWTKLLLVPFWI